MSLTSHQKKILREISKQAVKLDWEVAFGGKSYGNQHLKRVSNIITFLNIYEGGDLFILLAGGWTHDIALVYGKDESGPTVKKIATEFLNSFPDLSSVEVQIISDEISNHETGEGVISIEAKLIHDADVIDKSGMLGIIRHIWKMTNLLKGSALSTKADLLELQNHLKTRQLHLFTSTAETLATNLNTSSLAFFNSQEAISMMSDISNLAFTDDTSDSIAKKIIATTPGPVSKCLTDQLEVNLSKYLK